MSTTNLHMQDGKALSASCLPPCASDKGFEDGVLSDRAQGHHVGHAAVEAGSLGAVHSAHLLHLTSTKCFGQALARNDAVGQCFQPVPKANGPGIHPHWQPLVSMHQTVGKRWSFADRLEACPAWATLASSRSSTARFRLTSPASRSPVPPAMPSRRTPCSALHTSRRSERTWRGPVSR